MASFGQDVSNYGTVSGESSGFRTRSDTEFGSMKQKVGDAIMQLKRNNQSLQKLERQIGSSSDSAELRRRIQQLMRGSMENVETARNGLRALLTAASQSKDQGQKLAVQSLCQNVTSTVNEFDTISQNLLDKQHVNPSPPSPSSIHRQYLDSDEVEMGEDRVSLVRPSPAPKQQQQEFLVSDDAAYLEERAERFVGLESDIQQLHEIMGEIGQMVVLQGETVGTIEQHVEAAHSDVIHGNEQLVKAVKFKRCSRKLICVLVIIGLVFLVIIAIILAIVITQLSGKK